MEVMSMYYFFAEEVQLAEDDEKTTIIIVTSKEHWQKEKTMQYSFTEEELDELMNLEEIGIYEMAEGVYESTQPLKIVVQKLKEKGYEENQALKQS